MEAFLEEIDKLDDTGTTAAGEISSDNDAYIVTFLRYESPQ